MPIETLCLIALPVFLFAGAIKGLVGIGFPTTVVGILSQVTDPRLAIAMLLLPGIVTNAWQAHRSDYFLRGARDLWPFATALAVCIFVVSQFAAVASAEHLMLGIGCVIVMFVGNDLWGRPISIPERHDRAAQTIAGSLSGIMGGLTAIWSPPMVLYLLGRNYNRDNIVGAMGFIVLIGTTPLALGYVLAGLLTPTLAVASAAMVLPTWAGFWIGEYLRKRMDGQQFRYALLVIFLIMGLNLIRKALV